ncbi:MAG: hypothetical protein CM1200mP29_00910 [Verrucomicrobiota bacterium]|nr:MAG: hypothetical protein CM1200mP29_00910 [Verrucomicrobiota bacterium]
MKSDQWRSFEGRMELTWEHSRTDGGRGWQITGWKTTEMNWRASPRRLFVEALDTAIMNHRRHPCYADRSITKRR